MTQLRLPSLGLFSLNTIPPFPGPCYKKKRLKENFHLLENYRKLDDVVYMQAQVLHVQSTQFFPSYNVDQVRGDSSRTERTIHV
jgi:hypothetical protein